MKVETWDVSRPQPYPGNPRTISEKAIEKVAASIREFGFRQAIVVDEHGVILAGHARLEAAKRLDLTRVPVHVAKGLTEAQARAFRLADNRVAQETDWTSDLLTDELRALEELGLDLSLTGFDLDEIDRFLEPMAIAGSIDGFDEVDPAKLDTEYCCPKCGYEWSGKAK
jgi:ParB-like chromosome segregation protein Spo0J